MFNLNHSEALEFIRDNLPGVDPEKVIFPVGVEIEINHCDGWTFEEAGVSYIVSGYFLTYGMESGTAFGIVAEMVSRGPWDDIRPYSNRNEYYLTTARLFNTECAAFKGRSPIIGYAGRIRKTSRQDALDEEVALLNDVSPVVRESDPLPNERLVEVAMGGRL